MLPTRLIADYSFDAFPASTRFAEPRVLLALLLVGGLIGLALALLPRRRWLAAAILCHFVLLLPVSQIAVHHELLAEHRLYLVSLCFAGVLAAALAGLVRRSRAGWGLVAVLLATQLILTQARSLDWTSSLRLWSATVEAVPRCARAQLNLGVALARRQRFEEARPHLELAVQIDPQSCTARVERGRLLVDLHQGERGLAELRRAVECRASAYSLRALGSAALRLGRRDEAEAALRRARALTKNR